MTEACNDEPMKFTVQILFAAILALSGVSQSLAAEKIQLPDDLGTAMLYKAKRSDAPAVVVCTNGGA